MFQSVDSHQVTRVIETKCFIRAEEADFTVCNKKFNLLDLMNQKCLTFSNHTGNWGNI